MTAKYKSLNNLSDLEIKNILIDSNVDELVLLPLSVGMYHKNWKYAQNICVELTDYPNEIIQINSIKGLSYIAMNSGKLEKNIVKPVILKVLRDNPKYFDDLVFSICKINKLMNWDIAKNIINK